MGVATSIAIGAAAIVGLGCGRIDFDVIGPPFDYADPVGIGVAFTDPQLEPGGLVLWAAVAPPAYDLCAASRAAVGDAFGPCAADAALSSGMIDVDPAMSSDGLVLMFVSSRSGSRQVWETTRATTAVAFGPPVQVGVALSNLESIDVVGDGRTIYLTSYDRVLSRATRPDRVSPFGAPVTIDAPPVTFPTLSPDERLMLFDLAESAGVGWANRATIEDPFVDRGPLSISREGCTPSQLRDPDISPDGTRLVIRCDVMLELTR